MLQVVLSRQVLQVGKEVPVWSRDGTGSSGSPGQHFGPGLVGSRVSVQYTWPGLLTRIRRYKNVLSVRLSTVSILAAKQKLQTKCWDSFRDIVDDCANKLYGVACWVFAIPAFFTRRRKVEEWLILEPRIWRIMQAIAVLVMQQARYSNGVIRLRLQGLGRGAKLL